MLYDILGATEIGFLYTISEADVLQLMFDDYGSRIRYSSLTTVDPMEMGPFRKSNQMHLLN